MRRKLEKKTPKQAGKFCRSGKAAFRGSRHCHCSTAGPNSSEADKRIYMYIYV